METILKLDHVVKRFSGLVAVNDLSMEVLPRRIHALIGPNGSGKTTTVNVITGTLDANGGTVQFEGNPITNLQPYKIARLGVGRTFQNIKLFHTMTVLENLMIGGHKGTNIGFLRFIVDFAGSKREEKELREKAESIMEFVGVTQFRNETVKNLPYGWQKMTELGRTLMNDPKLILLDEPAAGLNPSERVEFINILQRTYEKGIDLFMIEHNMDVVMNISHMITVLNFGSKIAEGTPKEIQNNDEVIKAYLGERYRQSRNQI